MGLFIHSGQETQIAIYPQVTYTTNDAIGKLNHCYYYIVGLLKQEPMWPLPNSVLPPFKSI